MTASDRQKHVMVLTGEPSGDVHASKLVRQIKTLSPQVFFSGIGGSALEQEGVDLFFNIENLSAMGLIEIAGQFNKIRQAFANIKNQLKQQRPDLVILIDYPGFNLRVARFIKEHYLKIPVLYYIAPKVWAWNRSRLKKIKRYVDHAALILPFEQNIYARAGIPSTYVGNPLVDEYPEHLTKPFSRPDIPDYKKGDPIVIGILPGSRKSEVSQLLDTLLESAEILDQQIDQVRFIVSRAGSITREYIDDKIKPYGIRKKIRIHEGGVKKIFHQSDLIIAASGTVTLEAALACVPTILVYKMSTVTYQIARILVKIEYAGLANLIVNREVMPELLQHDATPELISKKVLKMLKTLAQHQNRLMRVRRFLGSKGASQRTAAIAVEMMNAPIRSGLIKAP